MYSEAQMEELLAWAKSAGEAVNDFLQQHMQLHSVIASVHAFRGLRRLARDVGTDRLNRACTRAVRMKAITITSIRSMLARNIENRPLQADAANDPIAPHVNVRGASHYE